MYYEDQFRFNPISIISIFVKIFREFAEYIKINGLDKVHFQRILVLSLNGLKQTSNQIYSAVRKFTQLNFMRAGR